MTEAERKLYDRLRFDISRAKSKAAVMNVVNRCKHEAASGGREFNVALVLTMAMRIDQLKRASNPTPKIKPNQNPRGTKDEDRH